MWQNWPNQTALIRKWIWQAYLSLRPWRMAGNKQKDLTSGQYERTNLQFWKPSNCGTFSQIGMIFENQKMNSLSDYSLRRSDSFPAPVSISLEGLPKYLMLSKQRCCGLMCNFKQLTSMVLINLSCSDKKKPRSSGFYTLTSRNLF